MKPHYLDAKYPMTYQEEMFIAKVWVSCNNEEQQESALNWIEDLTYKKKRLHLTTPLWYSRMFGIFKQDVVRGIMDRRYSNG